MGHSLEAALSVAATVTLICVAAWGLIGRLQHFKWGEEASINFLIYIFHTKKTSKAETIAAIVRGHLF